MRQRGCIEIITVALMKSSWELENRIMDAVRLVPRNENLAASCVLTVASILATFTLFFNVVPTVSLKTIITGCQTRSCSLGRKRTAYQVDARALQCPHQGA